MDENMGYGKTPEKLKKRIREGPAKGTKLDFPLEESSSKRLKPIEEGDMGAPSLVTGQDYKEVAEDMRSDVQSELAEIGKGRKLIKKVKDMPGITSESDNRMREMIVEQKPSDNAGGGILEMFGLAGGRKRRRKKSRKKKKKYKRKSRRKKRRKSKKRKSRRRRKKSRRRRK